MNTLDQLRGQIAAAKSELNTIKRAPATLTETRKAVDSMLHGLEAEWLSFEESTAHRVAVLRPGNRMIPDFIHKDLALSAAIYFNRETIANSIMERQKAIRAELGFTAAMSEQDRDAALTAAALKLYELELHESELLESMPEQLPRADANQFAMLGIPVESGEREVIFATIGDLT